MKQLFIVANWKSNKTSLEAKEWFDTISHLQNPISNKQIIICSSFTLLQTVQSITKQRQLPFELGAQDTSPFDKGAYTGEINGIQIKEFASHVIIGHSERRKNFHETDDVLQKKVEQAKKCGLTVIFCVQDETTAIPDNVDIVAYEPIFAIGSGKPDTPENANEVAQKIKENKSIQYVLYGGSVGSENVHSFTMLEHIDGVLVGGASLDPEEFAKIIDNA